MKQKVMVFVLGLLFAGSLVSCNDTQPIGETLKTFFEDFVRQAVAAAVT